MSDFLKNFFSEVSTLSRGRFVPGTRLQPARPLLGELTEPVAAPEGFAPAPPRVAGSGSGSLRGRRCTVCPRSLEHIHVVAYCIKWVTTSWTDGILHAKEVLAIFMV